jgi:hypothetical protein
LLWRGFFLLLSSSFVFSVVYILNVDLL